MVEYKGIGGFAILVGGIVAGSLIYDGVASYFRNQNIDSNYIKPKNAIVRTVDRNEDGYKEVVLEFSTKNGEKRTVDLTSENLEKLLQK